MDLPIVDFGKSESSVMTVPDDVFARPYNVALVHQAVLVNFANARVGSRSQKTRAQVNHSRKKLFRQKGTGRARAGHSSTPIRRGGGVAFPSLPAENFSLKITRRMFRASMAVVLSQLARENRLLVARHLSLQTYKTRDVIKSLSQMKLEGKTLLVDNQEDNNLKLAVRNLSYVILLPFSGLLLVDLIAAEKVVFSELALKQLIEVWKFN